MKKILKQKVKAKSVKQSGGKNSRLSAKKKTAKKKTAKKAFNPPVNVFGLIKQIRIGSTMSEKTLSIMTGTGVFRLLDLEAGKIVPTLGELLKIARVFGKDGLVLLEKKK